MTRSIEKNLLIWLVCALAPIGIIGYIAHQQTSKVVDDNAWVVHTHEVREEIHSILELLNTAETSMRGFIITGKKEFLEPYLESSPAVEGHLKKLGQLISDNPNQVVRVHAVRPLIAEKLDLMGKMIIVRKQKGLEEAAAMVSTGAGNHMLEEIRDQLEEMQGEEGKLLEVRSTKATHDTARAMNVTVILTVFALILVGCNIFFARLRA